MRINLNHLPEPSELALAGRPVMAKKCRASDWDYMQKTCGESFRGELPDHISGGEQGYMFSYNFGEPDEVWNWLPEKEFKSPINPEYKECEATPNQERFEVNCKPESQAQTGVSKELEIKGENKTICEAGKILRALDEAGRAGLEFFVSLEGKIVFEVRYNECSKTIFALKSNFYQLISQQSSQDMLTTENVGKISRFIKRPKGYIEPRNEARNVTGGVEGFFKFTIDHGSWFCVFEFEDPDLNRKITKYIKTEEGDDMPDVLSRLVNRVGKIKSIIDTHEQEGGDRADLLDKLLLNEQESGYR